MNPDDQLSRLQVREGFALTIDEAIRRLECALSLLDFSSRDLPAQIDSEAAPLLRSVEIMMHEHEDVRRLIERRLEALGIIAQQPGRGRAKKTSGEAPETVLDLIREQHAKLLGKHSPGSKRAALGETIQ